jgi:carbon-monoxide dehydrogenase small subunit|tara:strand:- start:1726 stop:2349 length:624 start_codon:yes stop_codon:yes gene_type:complete
MAKQLLRLEALFTNYSYKDWHNLRFPYDYQGLNRLGFSRGAASMSVKSKTYVTFNVNDRTYDFLCEPRQSLLECLRNVLGLTGTKEGCNDGNCGACTVFLDGRIVNSCLTLAVEAEGSKITTIEGIAEGTNLHPVQIAFLENAALQCGFCTPGFIVSAKALLDQNSDPSEYEIRRWLAGNLCRCTGYDKIVRAVMDSAKKLSNGPTI